MTHVRELLGRDSADLTHAERRQIDAHIAACTECRDLRTNLERTDRLLREREPFMPIPMFDSRRSRGRDLPYVAAAAGALALLLVLALAPILLGPEQRATESPTAPLQSPATTPAATMGSTPPPAVVTSTAAATSPAASPTVPVGAMTIYAIDRIDARTGLVSADMGAQPLILRTDNAAATWERGTLPGNTLITQIDMTGARDGWAIGRSPFGASPAQCAQPNTCKVMVLTTNDGGRSWTERFVVPAGSADGPGILDIDGLDAQRAWITVRTAVCDPAGCAHEIRGTDDGGRTWRSLRQPQQATEIVRASVSNGWVLGPFAVRRGGEILGTTDAGATWTSQIQSELSPRAIASVSERAAWAIFFDPDSCTGSGCAKYELLRTVDGRAWSSLGDPRGACPGRVLGLEFADESTGWMTVNVDAGATGNGGISRTTDGGKTWSCQTMPGNTYQLSAADTRTVWVTSRDRAGGTDTLWASDDGGQTWRQIDVR